MKAALDAPELSVLELLDGISVVIFDRDLRILHLSGQAFAAHGTDAVSVEGQAVRGIFEDGRFDVYEPLLRAALTGKSGTLESWSVDERVCYAVSVSPVTGGDGQLTGGMAVFEDITARKHSDEARRNSQERFELLFEGAPIAIALLAPDGRVVRANRSLLSTMGYSSEQLLSKRLTELTHPEDLSNDSEQLRRLVAGEIAEYQIDKRYLHARGHIIYARLSLSLMRDREDKPLHFIAHIQDLTEQRLSEQRLTELDQRDPLTGMLARRYFERELAQRVASHAIDGKISALAVFDVNDFRRINEKHGHRVGDDLLIKLATALTGRLRGTDLIARLGSDEFAVLLVDIQPGVAETVAGEVAGVLAGVNVQADGLSVSATVSHGVIYIGDDLSDGAEALAAAERAMRT